MKTNEKKIIRIFWLAVILLVLLAIMFAGYIRVIRPNADSKGLLLDNLAIDEQIPLESILGENGYLEISDVDDQIHSVTVLLKCEREDPNSSIKTANITPSRKKQVSDMSETRRTAIQFSHSMTPEAGPRSGSFFSG